MEHDDIPPEAKDMLRRIRKERDPVLLLKQIREAQDRVMALVSLKFGPSDGIVGMSRGMVGKKRPAVENRGNHELLLCIPECGQTLRAVRCALSVSETQGKFRPAAS